MGRKKRDGPRQAVRWIGDAFVLEGDLATGAPAVWRRGNPTCARVRITEMTSDWEFGQDDLAVHAAASALRGEGIVPRLATYRVDETLAIVDEDVGDLSLRELIDEVRAGEPPLGLALHVLVSLARALHVAATVRLQLRPDDVTVAWDGTLYCAPALVAGDDEIDEWADDPVGDVKYGGPPQRALGCIAFELLAGHHPWQPADDADDDADDDDDDDDDEDDEDDEENEDAYEIAQALRVAMQSQPPLLRDLVDAPASLSELVNALLTGAVGWDEVLARAAPLVVEHPFGAADLAAMLRGLFEDRRREGALEREDRLNVMPGPRVEPEARALFDADAAGDGETAGYETLDLDDVRRGHPDFHDGQGYEPAVDAIDPFDDDQERP